MVGAVGCFVVPAPKPEPDYRIDPNAKCPGCGAHDGKLLCIGGEKLGEVLIDHTCAVCQARWYEKPLLDDPQGRDLCPSGKSARNLMANGNGSGRCRWRRKTQPFWRVKNGQQVGYGMTIAG